MSKDLKDSNKPHVNDPPKHFDTGPGHLTEDDTLIAIVEGKPILLSRSDVADVRNGFVPDWLVHEFPKMTKFQLRAELQRSIPRTVPIRKSKVDNDDESKNGDGSKFQTTVYGVIKNGKDVNSGQTGEISHVAFVEDDDRPKWKATHIMTFFGDLIGVARYAGEDTPYLVHSIDGVEEAEAIDQFVSKAKAKRNISTREAKLLREVLDAYVVDEVAKGSTITLYRDPVYLDDANIVRVHNSTNLSLSESLRILTTAYNNVKAKPIFVMAIGWAVLAPLHFEIKKRAKKLVNVPLLAIWGRTDDGKTRLATDVIVKGFGQKMSSSFYGLNQVKTLFTITDILSSSALPAIFDDVKRSFFEVNAEELKTYVTSAEFGRRGTKNLSVKSYSGRRSFVATSNENLCLLNDIALSRRIIAMQYLDSWRMDPEEWMEIENKLADGWLLPILTSVLDGKKFDEILNYVYTFTSPQDWVNWGIDQINKLLKRENLGELPLFNYDEVKTVSSNEDWGQVFFDELLAENFRITQLEPNSHSELRGTFIVDDDPAKPYIKACFQTNAYIKIAKKLGIPYRNVSDFLNNIPRSSAVQPLNDGKPKSIWVSEINQPLKLYCLARLRTPKGFELDDGDEADSKNLGGNKNEQ